MKKNLGAKSLAKIPFKGIIIALLITNLLVSLLVIFLQKYLPPIIPLFYGKPRGGEQLAPSSFLLLPPGISILIILVNSLLMVFQKNEFLQKVLLGLMLGITLLSTITVIKILLLVGSL